MTAIPPKKVRFIESTPFVICTAVAQKVGATLDANDCATLRDVCRFCDQTRNRFGSVSASEIGHAGRNRQAYLRLRNKNDLPANEQPSVLEQQALAELRIQRGHPTRRDDFNQSAKFTHVNPEASDKLKYRYRFSGQPVSPWPFHETAKFTSHEKPGRRSPIT